MALTPKADHTHSETSLSPLRLGIGGPVGSGKTALTLRLCQRLRDDVNMAVVTNDIYTKEDSEFLTRHEAMPAEREILGFLQGFVGPQEIDDTAVFKFLIVQIRDVDRAVQEVHAVLSLFDPLFFRAGEASFPPR